MCLRKSLQSTSGSAQFACAAQSQDCLQRSVVFRADNLSIVTLSRAFVSSCTVVRVFARFFWNDLCRTQKPGRSTLVQPLAVRQLARANVHRRQRFAEQGDKKKRKKEEPLLRVIILLRSDLQRKEKCKHSDFYMFNPPPFLWLTVV